MKTIDTDPTLDQIRAGLDAYSAKYDYDVSYMRHMLDHHPQALQLFQGVIALANCRQHAPLDVFFVAKLAGFKQSDCGACLQLSIRLALEAGVNREIVEAVVRGKSLPPELETVTRFVYSLDEYNAETDALRSELRARYGEAALIEIALVVTAAHMFPRTKRALGYYESCHLMQFDFE